MFAYCRNNPLSRIDPSGCYDERYNGATKSTVEAICLVGLAGAAGGIILLTPPIIDKIVDTATQLVENLVTAIEHEAQRLQEKIQSNYQYWEAYLIKGVVLIGRGLTFLEACARVSCGLSVMCANQDAARWILVVNCYWGAVGPETHGDEGYYWHYHPHRNTHTHIWYYG